MLVHGSQVELTYREFEILNRLAEHPGWVFSADQLSSVSEQGDYSPESVSVHVSRLRHKLAVAGAPDVVETVRGFGYRLRSALADADDPFPHNDGAGRSLRDALWQLSEAVLEVDHAGRGEQVSAAVDALEHARRTIYAILAK